MENSNVKEAFRDQKWVERLVRIPEVMWTDHLFPLIKGFGLRMKDEDFNVYKYIEINDFIEKSTPGFRTALVGNLLNYIGIDLGFTRVDGKFIPNVKINPEKAFSAEETIGAIVRKRESDARARDYMNNRINLGIQIEDVKGRNSNDTK